MKQKLTLLILALLTSMGAWAAVTDLPEITTDANNPKLYVVKNTRSNLYAAYRSDSEKLRQIADISTATLWYFTEGAGTTNTNQISTKMWNYFAGKAISSQNLDRFNDTGVNVAIAPRSASDGVNLDMWNFEYPGYNTAMNDAAQTTITVYDATDGGSCFIITPIDDLLEDLRTLYSNKVDGCETLTAIFSSSDCTTAKTAITNATTGLEIIEAYETLIATADNQLISLKSHDAEKYVSFGSGIKATDSEGIIRIVSKHDLVAFQNPETSQYISCPLSQSSQFQASDTPDYFQFVFSDSYSGYVCLASSNARTSSGTLTMHDANNGSGNIVTWYSNAANSFFQPASKTFADFKTTIKSKLDAVSGWQPIYSASDIETAKADVDNAATIDDVNTIYEEAIKAADGKLLSIESYNNAGKYMSINATNVTTRTYPTVIKLVVNSDLTYSLQGYLNFDGYYAEQLKDEDYTLVASSATAGKYRLGYNNTKGFLFYSTKHSGCLHYSWSDVVRWYDNADASYWTVNDVDDAAYLGSYYNALLPYQATYGQYGYYKSGSMTKSYFDANIIETSAGILADLTTYASYITAMKAAAKDAYDNITPVVPVAGDFLRIKASDNNKSTDYGLGESNLYLTSSNHASKTDRVGFAVGDATDNTTIFYYDGTNLTGFANGLQPVGAGSYAQMSIGTVDAAPTAIAFDAIYGTEDHSYRVKFAGGGRALYTQRSGDGSETPYYYHSDAAGSGNDGPHYRYFLEKVTSLPVTISSVGLSTLYSPVALTIPTGVTAYVAEYNGTYLHLEEIADIIPANTGVILAGTASTTYNFDITTGGSASSALTGSVAAIVRPDNSYVLSVGDYGLGFYGDGATVIPGFKAYYQGSTNVKGFVGFEFDDATAIQTIDNGQQTTDASIFNLAGQRISKMQKGINIVNGKKIMY